MSIADLSERQQALDVTQSFIVQAPAGSGKTELLIQRVLVLLAGVKQPEEVLAITFTRKAAHEMRQRIIKAITRALDPTEPETAHEKVTWQLAQQVVLRDEQYQWQLLQNPNRLKIQTIDSLCASITKAMPLLSHLGSQPQITEQADSYYRQAAEALLKQLQDEAWSEPLSRLIRHCDNQLSRVRQLLIDLLKTREQWLPYLLQHDLAEFKHQLEDSLQHIVVHKLDLIAPNLSILTDCFEYISYAQAHLDPDMPLQQMDLFELNDISMETLETWQQIAAWLLTTTGEIRKQVTAKQGFPAPSKTKDKAEKAHYKAMKDGFLALLSQYRESPGLSQALNDLLSLPLPYFNEGQWQVLAALCQLLPLLVAQLTLVFRQHAMIDFTEIAQSALLALGEEDEPTDLAMVLDYKIQHILVDEFQDTSSLQLRLLQKLTAGWQADDGRTLFLVGDPMQSIYRFRQAEVGIFLQVKQQGLGTIWLQPLRLSANFRSTKNIIHWVNECFKHVLPVKDNINEGAIAYSPSTAVITAHEDSGVSLHPLSEEVDSAVHTTNLVKQLWQHDNQKTIAILVRARRHANEVISALREAEIPYQAVDIEYLVDVPLISDLLSLTKALLYPNDRVAWLSLLRAPWAGLSLNDLYLLAEDQDELICQRLCDSQVQASLSSHGQQVCLRIAPILQAVLQQRYRWPLRQWVEDTWILIGGKATINQQQMTMAKDYFALLDQHHLSDFKLDEFESQLLQLYAKTTQVVNNPVQVMTIHKSKGLEFDHVILPGLDKRPPSAARELLDWVEFTSEEGTHLLMAPIKHSESDTDPMSDFIRSQQQIKDENELARVLYVAATRAKQQLHLVYQLRIKEEGDVRLPVRSSLLSHLWPVIAEESQCSVNHGDESMVESRVEQFTESIKRLPLDWQLPASVNWQQQENEGLSREQQNHWEWQSSSQRILGTVIHQALQFILEGHVSEPQHFDWTHLLRAHGYTPSQLNAGNQLVQQAIQNILNDRIGQWLINAKVQDSQVEYALTGKIKGRVINGIIDRTFIDEEGVRWIIDYKVPQTIPQNLDEFLDFQQQQYTMQLERYAHLMALKENRPIKLGLYFPLIPAWREWDFDRSGLCL